MNNKERAAIILYKYLSVSPDIVCIYRGVSEAVRFEFFSSMTSHIEQLGREIIAFKASQSRKDDFINRVLGILRSIKGEAGMMEITEMSNVCHLTEVLLDGGCQVVPVNTLLSVRDWLLKSTGHLRSSGSGLYESFFNAECLEILCRAEMGLLDICMSKELDEQGIKEVAGLMRHIVELAERGERNDVRALAETALELLNDLRSSGLAAISCPCKEKIFDLLDAMKERVLEVNRFGFKLPAGEFLPDSGRSYYNFNRSEFHDRPI